MQPYCTLCHPACATNLNGHSSHDRQTAPYNRWYMVWCTSLVVIGTAQAKVAGESHGTSQSFAEGRHIEWCRPKSVKKKENDTDAPFKLDPRKSQKARLLDICAHT